MIKGIFVTGTDTGVGKTIICGCLARYLSDKGFNIITQKWIQTGSESGLSADIKTHLKIMGRDKAAINDYLLEINPYIFKGAYSPHLASSIENKIINADKILKSFKCLSSKFDFVIVEGVGGTLVPFDKKHLVIDIAQKLNLPCLIVARNKLGAINHTLLAVEALRSRKMKILGIVFNNIDKEDKAIIEDNPKIIKALTKKKIFGVLPKIDNFNKLYNAFIPVGERIYGQLA